MTRLLVAALACGLAFGQTPPGRKTGSIGGVIRDGNGSPRPDLAVRAYSGFDRYESGIDAGGRYLFPNLPPGAYRINVMHPGSLFTEKRVVTLGPGENLASIDFRVHRFGAIFGRVVDHNGEPLPGFQVTLVSREYRGGVIRHSFAASATTGEGGRYRLANVPPGTTHLVLVRQSGGNRATVSTAPADPSQRGQVYVPTYYPHSETVDGAEAVTLRDGEERELLDFQIRRSPSYCLEALLQASGEPAPLHYMIAPAKPAFGSSFAGWEIAGTAGPDGRIRICDLPRGEHRIVAYQPSAAPWMPAYYGTSIASITDDDAKGVTVAPAPRLSLSGEVIWEGAPPGQASTLRIVVSIRPLNGIVIKDVDTARAATSSLPGRFTFVGRMDDYDVAVQGLSGNFYVKDILYGSASVLNKPLSLGSGIGDAELRVIIRDDGGLLLATTSDPERNPVPDVHVCIVPEGVRAVSEFSAALVCGQSDQNGRYQSDALAPGKYSVFATLTRLDTTPEVITKLWYGVGDARRVEIRPNATENISIEPKVID